MKFEKIRDFLSWGKVAFLIISVVGAFATFVAGKIYGANAREAEIAEHTAQIKVHSERLDTHGTELAKTDLRLTAVESTQTTLGESVRKLEAAVAESNGKLDILLRHLIPETRHGGQ